MKQPSARGADIPDKKYFRIGEVSRLVGVDPHVLRYWETEFPQIRPHRGRSKQRLYRRRDVENLLLIRSLLHDEGYTISGARRVLRRGGDRLKDPGEPAGDPLVSPRKLAYIKKELRAILETVQGGKKKLTETDRG